MRSTLSFAYIVSVSCAYDRIVAFQFENGNRLDFHSWSHGSLNSFISSPGGTCDKNGFCKTFQSSVNCLENGCCSRGQTLGGRRREDEDLISNRVLYCLIGNSESRHRLIIDDLFNALSQVFSISMFPVLLHVAFS